MADAEQQTDGGVVHYAHHAAAEGLGRLRIRSGNIIDDGHLPDGTAASARHGRNVIHLHIGSGGDHLGAVRYSLREICRRKPVDSLNEVSSVKTRMSCGQGEHGMPATYGAKVRVAPERRQLSQRGGELGPRA